MSSPWRICRRPCSHRASGWRPAARREPGLPELERQLISRTLERVAGQRRQAAEILGISLDELNLKIRSYGLEERD